MNRKCVDPIDARFHGTLDRFELGLIVLIDQQTPDGTAPEDVSRDFKPCKSKLAIVRPVPLDENLTLRDLISWLLQSPSHIFRCAMMNEVPRSKATGYPDE